ncbi:MAG: NAD-dependent epimerase/dehydratase family protein [Elusimicrobiota bacterium]|nr:NAD-dependent epimerase/dehydratase family protein [Elusimicrobiota bacterium]
MTSELAADLDELLARTPRLWEGLRGARLFLTGGTGFFGTWLIESLLHADRELGLGAKILVLTRDEDAFRARSRHLADDRRVDFHRGDARTFAFPPGGFTHVVHAATGPSDVIVSGTRRTLEFAAQCGANKFLFTSSGAVYGRQSPAVAHVAENDPSLVKPLDQPSDYAQGKREAERLCVSASERGLDVSIARGFAFVGPHLPLDANFAIGNFIRDALAGGPIVVDGDGTTWRSYLYAADLAEWLWTILLNGRSGHAYNVGSERCVAIAELAEIVRRVVAPAAKVEIRQVPVPGAPAPRYVPSTRLAREELGLSETVALEESIRRTADWTLRRSRSISKGPI